MQQRSQIYTFIFLRLKIETPEQKIDIIGTWVLDVKQLFRNANCDNDKPA
ncbi:hypothetical protein GCM10027043_03890 [Ferruginibacter profundus]